MDRLKTQELVYFVAVAENLHFGRAADQLGIAQPPLSRAISKLERRLGVGLLDRTSRRVVLTSAGKVFLRECRKSLSALDSAVRRTQQAARPQRLVLAVRPGTGTGLLADVLDGYRQYPGAVPVDLVFTAHQATALHDGTADIGLICASEDIRGLDHTELTEELPVALLPVGHALAGRRSVSVADLARDDRFERDCPPLGLDEIVERVVLGQLVVVVGHSATSQLGTRITAVPVSDLPATQLVLGWPRNTPLAAREAFTLAAKRIAAREGSTRSLHSVGPAAAV
jgi:DNA-binding transcriptional LysR family regulator